MTWKLWTAIGAFGGCGLLVLGAVIKGALTKNVFRRDCEDRLFTYLCSCGERHLVGDLCFRKPRKTDHDKARNLASATLRRIHP